MINTYTARLSKKEELAKDIVLLNFDIKSTPQLSFVAGQYLILFCPNNGEPLRRLFSVASPATRVDGFEIVTKLIPGGVASEYFRRMTFDEDVTFQGPAGVFTVRSNDSGSENARPKVFLATGTGIAPIRSMLHKLLHEQHTQTPLHLFFGVQTEQESYFMDEFMRLEKDFENFHFYLCLSQAATVSDHLKNNTIFGRVTKGFEEKMIRDIDGQLSTYEFYLCGDRLVVESLRQFLAEKGIAKDQIIFEKF